jgi:hypothetical protein
MVQRGPIAAAALVLLGVALAAALLRGTGDGSAPKTHESEPPKTYQQLVAANYKVLRPRQSRRLLRFAEAFHACMVTHIPLGEPKALPTRIRMALPVGAAPSAVLRLTARCGAKLGDPPPRSSLLIRKHVIVLFLPKRCLLDPKIVGAGS